MTDLFAVIMPIFILIGAGFAATRWRMAPPQLVQMLGSFVINFALPALVLRALLAQDLRQTLDWNYILAYAVGSLAVFVGILALFRVALKKPLSLAAMAALGGSASNSGFVGFPIASLALGAPALTALPLSMMVENILIIPIALALGELGMRQGKAGGEAVRLALARLLRTPFILALLAGMALSAAGLTPPPPVMKSVEMMAAAAVPCALFVVGGTLAGLQATSIAGDVLPIVVAKLILHPIAVIAAFMLVGDVPAGLMAAGIILASSPMITIYPIFGARFGYDRMTAAALLVATTASFITLMVVLGIILPQIAAP